MNNITEQLGGLQNITCGVIQPGDKVTFTFQGERCIESVDSALPAFNLIGMPVEEAMSHLDLSVYREMPVPKPGGLDHGFPGGVPEGFKKFVFGVEQPDDDRWLDDPEPEGVIEPAHTIPQDSTIRKEAPMFRGLLGYFPAALFEVATHSLEADKKHNPGSTEGPTWARGKSPDHLDCSGRHLCEVGPKGSDGRIEQLRAVAWRALAALQEECEYQGAKPGVSSRF